MTRILAFGTYNKRKHPRVAIIIDGLRKNGIQVEEINDPLDLSTADRVEILKKPWKLFGFMLKLLRLWIALRGKAKKWISQNGVPDAVLVGYMGHFDVLLAHHIFPKTPIILDHLIFAADTARDRGASGVRIQLLKRLDHMAIQAASLVLVDTLEHQRLLSSSTQSLVVPVGASEEWYESGERSHARAKSLIFYGLYTPLQGTPIIAEAISSLAAKDIRPHITLIGHGQDYNYVRNLISGLSNVELINWIEPETLPRVVADHDIALGIFSNTPKGLRVIPNKVFQSMAAGCAVITSDTPPQRRELDDSVLFVEPGNAEALSLAIEALLSDKSELEYYQRRAIDVSQRFRSANNTKQLASWIECHRQNGVDA